MLRFKLFGFPVEVHWQFWLMTVLLSGAANLSGTKAVVIMAMWAGIVFVSILVHELGHALAMRHFGDSRVAITLYAMGGFAQGSLRHPRGRSIIVSAAGPAFSAALGVLGVIVARAFHSEEWWFDEAVGSWLWVNFGWTILNLFPILPLDGGRITEAALGPARIRTTLIIGIVFAALVALLAVAVQMWFTVLFFGMLAYSNWQQLNQQRPLDWMRP
jgi:Zn-dependent protease